jgi:hypothetical protein
MATNVLYAQFPHNMGGGDVAGDGPMDLLSDTIKLTLHTTTYAPNQATDEIKATATNELATGGGYTALGQALASKTFAATALVTAFDAADVTWTAFTNTFRYGVICDYTPTAPVGPLIALIDNTSQTITGMDLVFQWNAGGIFTITVS